MEVKDELDRQFFEEMVGVSDRTSAIAATAYLEDKLKAVIEAHLRPDKESATRLLKPTGPLGGLYHKAELAYLLNLYSAGTRDDIRTIGDIRNKFAHWAKPITFGHKEIRVPCESIGIMKRIFSSVPSPTDRPKPWDKGFSKFIFLSSIDALCAHLIQMVRDPNHPRVL